MSLVKWAFICLVALPAAEFVALVLVAWAIGWPGALALFVGTSVLGSLVLKRSGLDDLRRFRDALIADGIAAIHLETPGLAKIIGGILLVFPGFITDLLGVLLFIPPLRRWAATLVGGALRARRQKARQRQDPSLIDLAPADWHQVSEVAHADDRKSKLKDKRGAKTPDQSPGKTPHKRTVRRHPPAAR